MAPKSRSLRRAGPRKDPGPPKGSSVACDGHAAHSGLLAVCEPNSRPALLFPVAPAHSPLAPSSAPDGQRRAKPARFRSILPGTSLLMCNPARSDSHQHGRCGYRRFTRSNWPPVPRSGVAPLRSPQSLPRPRHPVKGHHRMSRLGSGPARSLQAQNSPGTSALTRPSLKEPE